MANIQPIRLKLEAHMEVLKYLKKKLFCQFPKASLFSGTIFSYFFFNNVLRFISINFRYLLLSLFTIVCITKTTEQSMLLIMNKVKINQIHQRNMMNRMSLLFILQLYMILKEKYLLILLGWRLKSSPSLQRWPSTT